MTDRKLCHEVDENMSEVLDGIAPETLFEHIAGCERCRDARHDAEELQRTARDAAADYRLPDDLEARVLARLPASSVVAAGRSAPASGATARPLGEADSGPHDGNGRDALAPAQDVLVVTAPTPAALARQHVLSGQQVDVRPGSWQGRQLVLGLVAATLGVFVVLGVAHSLRDTRDPRGVPADQWRATVEHVQRAFGSQSGLSRCVLGGTCQPLPEGAEVPPGTVIETDGSTRARLKLGDGSTLALDRATRLVLDPDGLRRARLEHGSVVAELREQQPGSSGESSPPAAVIESALGRAEVLGTKFSLLAERELLRAEVSRGSVRLSDVHEQSVVVRAGEAGQISSGQPPRVESARELGRSIAWSSDVFEPQRDTTQQGALGSLTAQRPRDQQELSHAVRLTRHDVRVQIVDNIARTEVEEVFENQTDEVLEGIYRFPLPPGAQIERLALDVDGKLLDGAYVERERAAAIWRGAIVNAGGKKPPPREEIVWVPGPWKDPALLEWQRGNRFELRIYPIPRRSSRRVVIAYTELLPPSEGRRQYVYPLPLDPAGSTSIDNFTLDVTVRGHDGQRGVLAHGYPLRTLDGSPSVTRLAFDAQSFTPSGDLVLSYQLQSGDSPLRAFAYQPASAGEPEPPTSGKRGGEGVGARARRAPPGVPAERPIGTVPGGSTTSLAIAADSVPADAPYVALMLRPELPRRAEHQPRDYVFVVDTSRSMIGESYRRALGVVERTVRELDRGDRVAVLGCDSECQAWPGGFQVPGDAAADAAGRFLGGIQPEGASDLALGIERAVALRESNQSRALRLVYVGDGTPTVGPIHPALLRRAVGDVLPRGASLSAVAVGSDADQSTLATLTEAAGGVTVAFAPGQSASDVAYALLGATYGHTLKNARLTLPDGLEAVAPAHIGSIAAGAEELIVARLTRPEVSGQAVLRGELGGEEFEQSYPLRVVPSTSAGNAFVPRLYAAVAIAELDQSMDERARKRSIELSTRFSVASRYTSLLVLESEAMFKAFGLDNQRHAPEWSGTSDSEESGTWGASAAAEDAAKGEGASDELERRQSAGSGDGWSGSLGSAEEHSSSGPGSMGRSGGAAAPAAKAAPSPASPRAESPAATEASKRKRSAEPEPDWSIGAEPLGPGSVARGSSVAPPLGGVPNTLPSDRGDVDPSFAQPPDFSSRMPTQPPPLQLPERRMVPMRRVYDRVGMIESPPQLLPLTSPERRAQLEVRSNADERSRSALKDLYVLDFLAGDLQRAADEADRWSEKDPLDPDALTARADLAAQRGQRELAIRILGSVVDVRPGDYKAQWRLARLHRWAGNAARGCRHSLAVAQLRLRDAKLVSEAVRCARDVGQDGWAQDLLSAVEPDVRQQVSRNEAQRSTASDELSGDLRVMATWEGSQHDLDLVILPPEGYRVSWLGAPTRAVISATDVLSVHREGLALRGAEPGRYAIEVVRASAGSGSVRGNLELTVGDARRTLPFVLEGQRLRVATANLRVTSRLVPLEGWLDGTIPMP